MAGARDGAVHGGRVRRLPPARRRLTAQTRDSDPAYARALFADGTAGLAYLLKERVGNRDELVRALHATTSGESVVDPRLLEVVLRGQRHHRESPLAALASRELDVLHAMAQGHTNPVIARELAVSESAVSKHIGAIFTKLGLSNDPGVDRRVSAVIAYLTDRL